MQLLVVTGLAWRGKGPAAPGAGWESPTALLRSFIVEVSGQVYLSALPYCGWYFQVSLHALSWNWSPPACSSGYGQTGMVRWHSFLTRKCPLVKTGVVLGMHPFHRSSSTLRSLWQTFLPVPTCQPGPQDLAFLKAVTLLTSEQDCPGFPIWSCRVTPQQLGMMLHKEKQRDRGQISKIPSPALGGLTSIKHWSSCFTGLVSDFGIQKAGLK